MSSEHKYFDICCPKGNAYPGLVTAVGAWRAGNPFLALTGGNHTSVSRNAPFLERLKAEGYEGIRLFLGHDFHVIEKIDKEQ